MRVIEGLAKRFLSVIAAQQTEGESPRIDDLLISASRRNKLLPIDVVY